MTQSTRRWPSAQQFASSVLLAAAMLCLVVGVVMAVGLMANGGDSTVSFGEWIITEILAMLLYGPMMVVTGFPVTIPLIIILGVLLAVGRLRYQRDRDPPAAARTVLIILFCYAGAIALTWAVLLLRPRGFG